MKRFKMVASAILSILLLSVSSWAQTTFYDYLTGLYRQSAFQVYSPALSSQKKGNGFALSEELAPNVPLFTQDFASSTVVADYVSATPNNGQFNAIGTSGAGTVVSINSGALQFARTGNAGSFSRTTDFSPVPSTLLYKVDITVTGNSTAQTTAAVFQVGTAFGTANAAESNANTYARFGINLSATAGNFSIRDVTGGTSSAEFSGTQTITWAMNNSGSSITYLAPDGSQETLANDTADIFVGTTRIYNDIAVQTAAQTITDLKFAFTAGTGTIRLDNFLIDPIAAITPNTQPSITASSIAPLMAGSPAATNNIATVGDTETPAGNLIVTAQSVPAGINITNITNSNGAISATLSADCGLTFGEKTIVLQVSDGSLTNTANLTFTVLENVAPDYSFNPGYSINEGGSTQISPTSTGDNGSISGFSLVSAGTYTGAISVNPTTGAVSISNAAPAGTHTITVRATDNCGAMTDTSFSLTVNALQPGTLQFSATDYTVSEGVGTATITVTRTGGTDGAVGVSYATAAGGTATGGGSCGGSTDYVTSSGTLSWTNGESASKTFSISVCDDSVYETPSPETVNLALTNPTGGAGLGSPNTAVLNITENDVPGITIEDASVTESDGPGSVNMTFNVSLSAASPETVTVDFATSDGTATGGADYTTTTGQVQFLAGETLKTIQVPVLNDSIFEANETFTLTLSNPVNATIADGQATGTITNNDGAPTLAIDDVTMNEGNSGTTSFTFTVTKTGATELNATVDFATANGTATIADNDYVATSGSLTFLPADATKTITIFVNGDTTLEPNETFIVNLSNAGGATISDNQGLGTITNDDVPTVSVNSPSVTETNSANTYMVFDVTLNAASSQVLTVSFQTSDGTATSSGVPPVQDYTSTSGQVTFQPGETLKQIQVPVLGDTVAEADETFFVTLSDPVNATIGTGVGTGTILNDDSGDTVPPVITYTPISSNPGSTSLTVTGTDAVGVTGVNIFWSINSGSFTSAPCSSSGGTPQDGQWTCVITGASNPSAVAYYVTATDAAANTATNPTGGATAPNLFTIGAATVPAGTYTNLNLGQGVLLGGNVDVIASLNLNGVVNAGANTLTLECAAIVTGGGEFSYVIGKLEKHFCGTGTFTFNTGASFALPPLAPEGADLAPEGFVSNYSPVTVTITAGTVGSSLTVSATDNFLPGSLTSNSASRYWTLTENGNLTANLAFTYRNEDVNGDESTYKVLRRAGGFTTQASASTNNPATNTATVNGITNFSDWGVGNAIPTAANAEIGGRVMTAGGLGIRNATVMLTGGNLSAPIYAQTGSFGYYRFTGLPVGQTYIVTVTAKRYAFTEPTRALNLVDNAAEENFVAEPQ